MRSPLGLAGLWLATGLATGASALALAACHPKDATPPQATGSAGAVGGIVAGYAEALAEGDRLLAEGDGAHALEAYLRAQLLDRRRAAPLVGMARARLAAADVGQGFGTGKGDPAVERARDELVTALALEPGDLAAERELGRTLLLAGDATGALAPLERAAERTPDDADLQGALGVARLGSGQAEGAIQALLRATLLDPRSAARHDVLATALLALGNQAEAERELRAAVALAPDEARYHAQLGAALLARDAAAEAAPELERALGLEPDRAEYLNNLGFAYERLGRADDAMARYRRATELDPELGSAWLNLGNALGRRGDFVPARACFDKAAALDPKDARVAVARAELDELEKSGATGKP